jgi:hypothetical protein
MMMMVECMRHRCKNKRAFVYSFTIIVVIAIMSADLRAEWPPYWETQNIPKDIEARYAAELKRLAQVPTEQWRDMREYSGAQAAADIARQREIEAWWAPRKRALEAQARARALARIQAPVPDTHWLRDRT